MGNGLETRRGGWWCRSAARFYFWGGSQRLLADFAGGGKFRDTTLIRPDPENRADGDERGNRWIFWLDAIAQGHHLKRHPAPCSHWSAKSGGTPLLPSETATAFQPLGAPTFKAGRATSLSHLPVCHRKNCWRAGKNRQTLSVVGTGTTKDIVKRHHHAGHARGVCNRSYSRRPARGFFRRVLSDVESPVPARATPPAGLGGAGA